MRFVFFVHSLISDWNHGNAHFQRGVIRELQALGHDVRVFEPADGWSRRNLVRDQGEAAIEAFHRHFPNLSSETYRIDTLDLDRLLDGADVAIVHEWSDPRLVAALGRRRRQAASPILLFHDTHHRSVSDRAAIARLDLDGYDGVLAFGEVVRAIYLAEGWAERVWTWHEAADTRLAMPPPVEVDRSGIVWIGNWGDGERSQELETFLLEPVRRLQMSGTVHGVRYPGEALGRLRNAGLVYRGWLANALVPDVFARHALTVHVPRRPYVDALPGVPTIRVFEALACGIPLISAPFDDCEGLFEIGRDFLMARDGEQMAAAIRLLANDRETAREIAAHGRRKVLARHTCRHRVHELLDIVRSLSQSSRIAAEVH